MDYQNDLGDIFQKYNFYHLKNEIVHKISNNNKNKKILILGTNEFMHIPFLFAEFLKSHLVNYELQKDCKVDIVYQATGRSPLLLGNDIKEKVCFKDNYDDSMNNYLYNCKPEDYDYIMLFSETNASQNKHFEVLNHWHNLKIVNLNNHV